jgi:O-acetyl-ADP-ribose deacetylase
MPVILAALGDITKQDVDAIVNAANNAMRGGGGVDGAIHRAGGPAILRDCIARFPDGLATGDAGWTTSGDLPAQWVIHTVGPNYRAGQRDRSVLASCYRRALQVADELGARSVAFPLISAGVYGWPLQDAIAVAIETIASTQTDVKTAVLVALDADVHYEVCAFLQDYRAPLSPMAEAERLRLKHDWDPAPPNDSGRFIIRDRSDGEAGLAVILADSDTDYRTYHLGPDEIDLVVEAMTRTQNR